ncbi:endonuclease/exonuclease/phosphatase (EEP) superfamily protein YafD [Pasteurella langaaensis DSM 22999]|uniref:Endonuclease/exonuclease/phosphatase (EEP) superfamily protein YafD n=2 Tax=Alitibacter langaaensis TaxID=756 RepID=A0A2U0SKU5_9PAST|nr:endonuclease/exonuclease/phosphatase (EEP) superfamily protein YafD [Pasteurella langaaensis DSM 22999]
MLMKKITKILTALCVFAAAAVGYVAFNLRIYHPPLVVLNTSPIQTYQPKNAFCDEATRPVSPLSATDLNVLVWNMHKGADRGWQQDLAHFAQRADFMLLQEASEAQNLNQQYSSQFPTALFAAGFAYKNIASGVQTFAKFNPDMYCAATGEEPWLRIPKVASALRFPLANGESLLVVNVHLVNFEWTPQQYRKQLTTMMERIAEHKSAVILAGDFNSWNKERLALIRSLAAEQGLHEVAFANDQRLRFWGQLLDHIFVRGLTVKQAETVQVQSSDHNPLWVKLEFTPPQR